MKRGWVQVNEAAFAGLSAEVFEERIVNLSIIYRNLSKTLQQEKIDRCDTGHTPTK